MTVTEFIKELSRFESSAEVLIASDEELNTLFKGFEIARLEGENSIVIYGLDRMKVEE